MNILYFQNAGLVLQFFIILECDLGILFLLNFLYFSGSAISMCQITAEGNVYPNLLISTVMFSHL